MLVSMRHPVTHRTEVAVLSRNLGEETVFSSKTWRILRLKTDSEFKFGDSFFSFLLKVFNQNAIFSCSSIPFNSLFIASASSSSIPYVKFLLLIAIDVWSVTFLLFYDMSHLASKEHTNDLTKCHKTT